MDWITEYETARESAGVGRLDDWSVVVMSGEDRVSFLQSFCTNDVQRLAVGESCEAFVTDAKGKILAHIVVVAAPEQLIVISAAGSGEDLAAHLDRYHIREDLTIAPSPGVQPAVLFGPQSDRMLADVASARDATAAESEPLLQAESAPVIPLPWFAKDSRVVLSVGSEFIAACVRAGAVACRPEVLEALRIETGTPRFGQDFDGQHLPQEVDRNELAISFTKGCYLGQETVARIDALGHVNRQLCRVVGAAATGLVAPFDVEADGKSVGRVSSWSFSPTLGKHAGLAMIRRGHEAAGTRLTSPHGEIEVV